MTLRLAATMGLLALAGCSEANQPVAIEFRATDGAQPIGCSSGTIALTDLRFFVSEVALVPDEGEAVPVTLDSAAPWQNERVALVDLEDGSEACDSGSPLEHGTVTGRAAAGSYRALRFTIGVPFDLNHANPAKAEAPLDQTIMHWHWQAGYKFLRAGFRDGSRTAWIHLGSGECRGRIGAVEACDRSNRIEVTLPFDAATDAVSVDVGRLFDGALGEGETGACMAEADNTTCQAILANLSGQEIFSRVRR